MLGTVAPDRDAWTAAALSLLLVVFNAAYVSAYLGPVHGPRRVGETDHFHYIEMAKAAAGDPSLARDAPYCWRLLVPALAGPLWRAGIRLHLAFYILTNLALLGFLFVLYLYLRDLGLPRPLRLLASR